VEADFYEVRVLGDSIYNAWDPLRRVFRRNLG
jgi:hypothetical protein